MSFLKLSVFLVGCFFLGKNLINRKSTPFFNFTSILYFAIGLLASGYLYLVTKYFSAPWWLALSPHLLAGVFSVFKRNLVFTPPGRIAKGPAFILGVCFLLYTLPNIVQGLRMGFGAYPKEFYSVDTPYYLSFVHALLQQNSLPIYSLEDFHFVFDVQLGVCSLAALISALSGLAAHTAFVVVVLFLGMTLYFAFAAKLAHTLAGHLKGYCWLLFLLLLLIGTSHYMFNFFKPASWIDTVLGEEKYVANFPLLTSFYGLLITLAWLLCVLKIEEKDYRITAGILAGLLIVYKIVYAPVVMLGYGSVCLYQYWRTRKPVWLAGPAAALAFSYLSYKMFSPGALAYGGTTRIVFSSLAIFSAKHLFYCRPVFAACRRLCGWRLADTPAGNTDTLSRHFYSHLRRLRPFGGGKH